MLRGWETERLSLRQIGPEDAALVRDYGLRCRSTHAQWDPVRPDDWWELSTVADRMAFEIEQSNQDRGLALYLSLPAAPFRIVGRVGLNTIIRGALQSCTVGYGLEPAATGKGLMTEALNAAVDIAFTELDLHRVEVNVVPRNERSLAVVRRCGFEQEGLSRRYICIAGTWEDHLRFARVREDG